MAKRNISVIYNYVHYTQMPKAVHRIPKKSLKIPKNRQCNGQNKIDKLINNDLQNTMQKTKDRAT